MHQKVPQILVTSKNHQGFLPEDLSGDMVRVENVEMVKEDFGSSNVIGVEGEN